MHVRSLFAVAVAALLPVTTHAAQAKTPVAQARPAAVASSSPRQLSLGGWIGYEMGDLDGIQLRVDGVMPFQKLAPQIELSFVGSVGYSRLTESAFGVDVTANILKFVPAARFTLPVNPQLSLFGDAGLGLYYASLSTDIDFGFGSESVSDSTVGLMLRLGAGGLFQVNPRLQVGASIYLDPMLTGDYDDTTFSILAGLTYQL